MKSQRTTGPGDEKLLLATRQSVVLHGVRRTTANDIAERAGISRMTFYRRMGSVENAVLATLTREFRTAAAGVRSASPAGTGREQLVHFAIQSVRVFATSELLDSIAERDPEFLIPYVTDRFGASQQLILDQLDALIAAGQAYPSLPQFRTASPAGSAARPAGVGQRFSHSSQTGSTRTTGVCCSMISLTSTPQAPQSGSRHGRSRAVSANQPVILRCRYSTWLGLPGVGGVPAGAAKGGD